MKLITVNVAHIQEQYNPRADFAGMKELVASIESVGLLQPIVVQVSNKSSDGKVQFYLLVDGARRLRALKTLGHKETQARVVEASTADEAQMAANLVRLDLNILERGRGYAELIKKYPARYSPISIAKMFGISAKDVKSVVSYVAKIDKKHDAQIAPHLTEMGLDGLEMISQVPAAHHSALLAQVAKENGNVRWALDKVFHSLSYSSDAMTAEKLVSEGKAFRVGKHQIYTADKEAYAQAKKAWEKKNRQEYGAPEKESEAVSEKARKAKAEKLKKDREARALAAQELPAFIKNLLKSTPGQPEIDRIGREICEKHMNFDTSRRMAVLFGVKLKESTNCTYSLREALWHEVFSKICITPDSVVQLNDVLSKVGHEGYEVWLKNLKKGSK